MDNNQKKTLTVYRPLSNKDLGELRGGDKVLVELSELREHVQDIQVLIALKTTAYGNHNMHWCDEEDLDEMLDNKDNLAIFEGMIAKETELNCDNWTDCFKRKIIDKKYCVVLSAVAKQLDGKGRGE
jgi:hypothetical protein